MRQPKVAYRYSKALFDLAVERGQLEEVMKDVEFIRSVTTDELRVVLRSPVIRGDKKYKIFQKIFEGKISHLTLSFFHLVFDKGREVVISEIRDAFYDQYRKFNRIIILKLTTSVPVSDDLKEDIKQKFQARQRFENAKVELEYAVDEYIIGGFVVQYDDQIYDASIRHDLQVIKRQFVENLYILNIR